MTHSRLLSRALWGLLAIFLLAAPLAAERELPPHAAGPGELIETKGSSERAEIVVFETELVPALLRANKGETLHIADWPTGPDARADVVLTRRDVYAPDARIFVADRRGVREVPRSRLAFFAGTAEDDPEVTVFAAVDPDSGLLDGFTQTRESFHELHPLSSVPSLRGVATGRKHLVAPAEVFRAERGEEASWSCGQSGAPLDFLQEMQHMQDQLADQPQSAVDAAISTLHTATVAVDTDNELMQIKFANNATTATNYIASLIASMTVIYERDLLIRLLQGVTILRPSTTADPYNQAASGNASGAKLQEFANIWNTTYASVPRAVAMMLSGKQPNGGASGIAWVNGLCNKYYGTSFSQVYTTGTSPSAGDILVVAHEVGHNFGSPHTHCYSPPIDQCYNAEGGCYTGTKSCPAPQTINGVTNVTGTLMSYCHLSGISGCTSKTVFHPASVSLLNPIIESKTIGADACIFPYVPPGPTVSAVNPKSGPTAGGTSVTITGTGFQAGASVTFGGTPATSVVVVDSTRITAVTPAKPAGIAAVAVTNLDGQSSTLSNGFFYAPPAVATDFYTLTPCRILDTRNPNGPFGGPALSANQIRTFTVTGSCGVPAGAQSIAVNVTVVSPGADGLLQIFPGNAFPLGTSTLNFRAGQVRANNSMLMLSTNGTGTIGVQNASTASTHVIIDVVGYNL